MSGTPREDTTQEKRQRVGPFRVLARLGGGGMGVVYRCEDLEGHPVAVKTIHRDFLNPTTLQRFARESTIRIEHPNVIRTLDAGADADGTPFIVLELLQGESLDHILERGLLSPADVIDLARQSCAGLSAAHALSIIHRDLKPANIFRCEDGTVKVLDFGVAHLGTASKLTADGSVVGTLSYLSPEQARGVRDLDARCDVWALGMVMMEALTGETPFDRDTPVATVMAILQEPLPPILAGRAPDALREVIERCLSKDRKERYVSTAELDAALEAVAPLASQSVQTPEGRLRERSDALARTTLRTDEQRVVVVLLAHGVKDEDGLRAAITEARGTAIPFLGGGMVGMFGGEKWEGDEIVRAIRVALACRGKASRLAVGAGRARTLGANLAGEAIASAERGCAAELAGVAVETATAMVASSQFILRRVSDTISEVVRERDPGAEGSERLVGRDAEIALLELALESVIEENRSRGVVVTGPMGIGKSALVREAIARLESSEVPVRTLSAAGEPLRAERPYDVLGRALRAKVAARGSTDPAAALRSVVSEAITETSAANDCATFLGELIGVPTAETLSVRAARSDPRLMADLTRLAMEDYLDALVAAGPTALVIDDAHWVDEGTLSLLGRLVEKHRDRPLLVLVAGRDKEPLEHGLDGADEVFRFWLEPLGAEHVKALAARMLGRTLPDAIAQQVSERTLGNPLFIEQALWPLRDRPDLGALTQLLLPVSVEAAVQARLDMLPEVLKEACKHVSAFGRPFTRDELSALPQPPDAKVLEVLLESGMWRTPDGTLDGSSPRYQLENRLTLEVAYRMLTPEVRRELHARIAAHLASGTGHDAEEVARHYEDAAQPTEAARWWSRAAIEASTRGDSRGTLRCAEKAVALELPEPERYPLHMIRADALRFLGRRDEQAEVLQAASDTARDDAERARALTEYAALLTRLGRGREAIAIAQSAIRQADATTDADTKALARGRLAEALMFAGDYELSGDALEEASLHADHVSPLVLAQLADWRARLAGLQGELGLALTSFREATRLLRQCGDVRRAAASDVNVADALHKLGDFEHAAQALRETVAGCRRVGHRLMEGYALANLGHALIRLGRMEEALEQLMEAGRLADSIGDGRLTAAVGGYRAKALYAGGNLDEAIAVAEEAGGRARAAKQNVLAALADTQAALAWLAKGDAERALRASSAAMAVRDQLGGLEEGEGEVFLTHARALAAIGRTDEARTVREAGRARLAEIASRIGDIALRAQFLSIPEHRALSEET